MSESISFAEAARESAKQEERNRKVYVLESNSRFFFHRIKVKRIWINILLVRPDHCPVK